MSYFAALHEATNDQALRGATFNVYVWLLMNHLDPVEYRPVKINGLAFTLKMKRHTVIKALRTLVVRGYLERKSTDGEGYAYRAFLNRRKPLVPENGHTQRSA